MKSFWFVLFALLFVVGCISQGVVPEQPASGLNPPLIEPIQPIPEPNPSEQTSIISAQIVGDPVFLQKFGDSWFSTWADDDKLYLSWGDGTGRGDCYPEAYNNLEAPFCDSSCGTPESFLFCDIFCSTFACNTCYAPCTLTDAGLVSLEGSVPYFTECQDECIVSLHIPTGTPLFDKNIDPGTLRNDKPSSLLFYNKTLYWAGHSPAGHPDFGYLAYSHDYGRTWTEVEKSPWTNDSVFRVLMFINMGRNYELNQDGYVYAFGIGSEEAWTKDTNLHGREENEEQTVYLTRVPKDSILDYGRYEYYVTIDENGNPIWSGNENDATPLEGLETIQTASAMYHEGTGKYLFLTASPGALFEAPQPWGPWRKVAPLFNEGDNSAWKLGGYVPGIITKDAGPNYFYFTLAGGPSRYQLHIGKIEMELNN
ncbi:MAG: DUF4185 domain-containing protein [Candidatus Micrarchaeota archaeon]